MDGACQNKLLPIETYLYNKTLSQAVLISVCFCGMLLALLNKGLSLYKFGSVNQ